METSTIFANLLTVVGTGWQLALAKRLLLILGSLMRCCVVARVIHVMPVVYLMLVLTDDPHIVRLLLEVDH